MYNDILISPSILSADVLHFADDIATIESEADLLHVDVMDGAFVPNITFGLDMVRALKRSFDLPLDVHLMVANPDESALAYAEEGAELVTFHYEASLHPHRLITSIQNAGAKAGVAINPGPPAWARESLINIADMVLVMTVEPGFGGQAFIDYSYDKIRTVRSMVDKLGKRTRIEVDGGVSPSNAAQLAIAGADVLVAGSAVFGAKDRAGTIKQLRENARSGVLKNL